MRFVYIWVVSKIIEFLHLQKYEDLDLQIKVKFAVLSMKSVFCFVATLRALRPANTSSRSWPTMTERVQTQYPEEEKPKPKYCLTLITFDIFLTHIKDRQTATQRAKLVFNFVAQGKLICLVRWPNRTQVKLTFKRPVGNTKTKQSKATNSQEKGRVEKTHRERETKTKRVCKKDSLSVFFLVYGNNTIWYKRFSRFCLFSFS